MTPRLLDGPTQYAYVNYYRCPECGHVWTTPKDGSGVVTHITEPPPNKPRRF